MQSVQQEINIVRKRTNPGIKIQGGKLQMRQQNEPQKRESKWEKQRLTK